MPKSNRDLCVEIIDSLPEEELARVFTLLKSIKFISDEIINDSKNADILLEAINGSNSFDLLEKLKIK